MAGEEYEYLGNSANRPQTLGGWAIQAIRQRVTVAEFTDNANTTGYIDLSDALPIGAIPLGWRANVHTGFTGDTSAVIQLGIAGDLDRFSASVARPVFTAAKNVGSNVLAADAANGTDAAQTVRVTVTTGSDFGLAVTAAAGDMTVTLFYLATQGAAADN